MEHQLIALQLVGGGSHCTRVQAEGMPGNAWAMAFSWADLTVWIV
jgi:hypothetical protein